MKLDGVWRVRAADDNLRRDAIGTDVDDSEWDEIEIPGHWRNYPKFSNSDGPLLYRRGFRMAQPANGRRRWITLDGVFYQADVWLDGAYIGDPEGYFFAHTYDITALSRIGDEHIVAVEVACAPQRDRNKKRNITGVFQNWDGIDQRWNPGGLWRSVHIFDTGPVYIDRYRVLCRDTDETRAHLLLAARLDSDASQAVTIRTLVDGECMIESQRWLASGTNDVNWKLDIGDPRLWWPRLLGPQELTEIAVEVIVDGTLSDRRTRRTGLREVAWNNWSCSVNGERIFLKAANLLPTRLAIGAATVDECRRDIELAVDVGLDAVRVHGHIAQRATYDAADECGLLIMQDFPLQWGYDRSVRSQAVEQARAAVDTLGHHPSIVQWSAHNDPASIAIGINGDSTRARLKYAVAQQLPSWNKSVLDRWVKRSLESADPTRLVSAHSGVLPHAPLFDGTDSHFYFGWYHGALSDIDTLARRVPRVLRFLSEFGAQATPTNADFIAAQLGERRWPDLDWDLLAERYGLQKWVFDERVPPAEYATYEAWSTATRSYQVAVIKHHVELLRRLKYRPVGGFALFAFNDPCPMVSFSVLDHLRSPKPGYAALRAACQPILVMADALPTAVTQGERLKLRIYAVNDTRSPVEQVIVDVELRWAGGSRHWRFGGSLPPDDAVTLTKIDFQVPKTLGRLELRLRLAADKLVVTNSYRCAVTIPATTM